MTTRWSAAPTLTSIVATFTFAVIWMQGYKRAGASARVMLCEEWRNPLAWILTAGATMCGAFVISAVLDDADAFYCAPAVPWRIEVALLGSFTVGLASRIGTERSLAIIAYPLSLIAMLWIAPFYGYFSSAIFLGLSATARCTDQPLVQIAVVAAAMLAGRALGDLLARWLVKA